MTSAQGNPYPMGGSGQTLGSLIEACLFIVVIIGGSYCAWNLFVKDIFLLFRTRRLRSLEERGFGQTPGPVQTTQPPVVSQ